MSLSSYVPLCLILVMAGSACAQDAEQLVREIRAVGPRGEGSERARVAYSQLRKLGPESLPTILDAMDTPDVVVANWLRVAFDDVWQRGRADAPGRLPLESMRQYVLD